MHEEYEVFALKYADRNSRIRADSFLFDDDHASPHDMDYFVWVIRNANRTIVVDTGYDDKEAAQRDRTILRDPVACLADFGIAADEVETVIISHLHYDHAGKLPAFEKATFHIQAAELAFATGPCMCHDVLRAPFTVDHVCDMVKKIYSGKVLFHDGDGEVAPGISVHRVGGHSSGLQIIRVMTANGPLILASDASHYYENFLKKKLFPIVVDSKQMLAGFDTLIDLAPCPEAIIPGHDPLVRQLFPEVKGGLTPVHRLDVAPLQSLNFSDH
ncbi:MAG: N-acyl homoserine lactonase family protein [Stappiaceae bacterium]